MPVLHTILNCQIECFGISRYQAFPATHFPFQVTRGVDKVWNSGNTLPEMIWWQRKRYQTDFFRICTKAVWIYWSAPNISFLWVLDEALGGYHDYPAKSASRFCFVCGKVIGCNGRTVHCILSFRIPVRFWSDSWFWHIASYFIWNCTLLDCFVGFPLRFLLHLAQKSHFSSPKNAWIESMVPTWSMDNPAAPECALYCKKRPFPKQNGILSNSKTLFQLRIAQKPPKFSLKAASHPLQTQESIPETQKLI